MNLSVNQYQPSSDQEDQNQSSTEDEDDEPNSNPLISPPRKLSSARITERKTCKGEKLAAGGGGRLLRPTGRKDRHSKVSTARGPRDRRVRLSAHTAIQFYDVQDRLGCERPSEAIEWLMKKARAAIEALDESPSSTSPSPTKTAVTEPEEHQAGFLTCGYESQKNLSEDPIDGFSFFVENNHPNGFDSISRTQNQSFCLLLQSPCESSSFFNPQGVGSGQEELFSQGGTLQSSFYVPSMTNLVCDQIPALCSSPVAGNVVSGDGFSGFFRGENLNAVPNKYPRSNW